MKPLVLDISTKVVLVLLNEIVVAHLGLIFIYVKCTSFEKSLLELVKVFRARVLDVRIVLKICCRLFSVYLDIWKAAKYGPWIGKACKEV